MATTKSWLVSGFQIGSILGASIPLRVASALGVAGLPSSVGVFSATVGTPRIFLMSSMILPVFALKGPLAESPAAPPMPAPCAPAPVFPPAVPPPENAASWLLMFEEAMLTCWRLLNRIV